jgi:CubicO group peptidase (beta-lactamase class C family)
MTATLAAVMIQEGMFDWELTVGEAFSGEPFEVHADYQPVTLVELLSHRAGVPSDLVGSRLWQQLWRDSDASAEEQRKRIVADYLPRGPIHPPKSKFQYSNVGYVVAGRMLEKRGGKSFEALLSELVFQPLEMASAGFGPPGGRADPRGHRFGIPLPPSPLADNPPGLSSAGRVHMTLADWGKFAAEHLRAARGESTKLLTPASAKRLHHPIGNGNYALGWGVPAVDWLNPPVLAHAGSNTMWRAEIWIVPERNVAFLVTVNEGTDAAAQAAEDVVRMLADRYAPPADVLAARKTGQIPVNTLEDGFTLKVRDESGKASEDSPLFVACNHNRWNPGDPAWKMDLQEGVWILKVPQSRRDGRMELKITRGSWETVEVNEARREVPNRRVGFAPPGTSDAVMEFAVPAFADQRGD